MRFLLISSRSEKWARLAQGLEKADAAELVWTASGHAARQSIQEQAFDLVLIDETLDDMQGLDLAQELIKTNPMLNCALASALSSQAFHEASEGLGLLAQLPLEPGEAEARDLIARITTILKLTQSTG